MRKKKEEEAEKTDRDKNTRQTRQQDKMTTEEDRHGEEMLTHTTWRSDRRWKLLLIPS